MVGGQLADRLEAAQSDVGVDLDVSALAWIGLIVAIRVRNAAFRLDELEQRIDRRPVDDEVAGVPPEVAQR